MNLKLSYLAGVIDSDGCIHIERYSDKRRKNERYQYVIRLQVGVTDRETIDWIVENFGGDVRKNIYVNHNKHPNRRDMLIWRLSSNSAIEMIERIYPYLVLKKPRAKLALEFKDTLMTRTEARGASMKKIHDEKIEKKKYIYDKMKILNRRGVKHGV